MRPLARWGTLPLLATPIGTWALGLGEIELHSALNQPLDAEIELVSATAEELASLNVSLAPLASFERYGLDRPAFLNSFVFELGRNAAGASVVRVSSTQSIAEPFVTILVEAEWARGRLLREYTVFLDPPVLLPAETAVEPVAPPQTRAPQPSVAGGAISRNQPAPAPAPAPRPAPAAGGVSERATAGGDGSTFGPVQSGETLWGITSAYLPAGVSMNQAMVAIYRANPDAFGGNMNHLRRGAILRIPPAGELGALPAGDATAEVRRQNDAWQPGGAATPQQRLVLVPPTEVPAASGAGGAAAGGANAAELAALRSQVSDLQTQLAEQNRLLELRNQELADLQNQLAAGDADGAAAIVDEPAAVADPGRALESEPLFADEPPVPADGIDTAAEAPVEEPVATPPTQAAPVQPARQVAPPPPPPPSLLDRVIDMLTSTYALITGGIVLILIGALMFLRGRREEVEDATGQWEALEADLDDDDEEVAATARMRAQSASDEDDIVVVESETAVAEPDDAADDFAAATGSFSGVFDEPEPAVEPPEETMSSQTLSSQTVINLDQADPIAEADFHMAYGLYDQAADLVSKALEADPDNMAYRLKLLEVFFVWGNKDSFLEAATALKQDLGDAGGEWAKVIIMGKQICPDDPLFADAQAAAGAVDLDLEAGDSPGLDLAFDADDGPAVDLDISGDDDAVDLDFSEVSSDEFTLEDIDESPAEAAAEADEDILDIGERTQAGLEAALFEMDEEGAKTSPGTVIEDISDEMLAATQESPTIETPAGGFDLGGDDAFEPTIESPTVEASGPDLDDSPTLESLGGDAPTVETPTIETAAADAAKVAGQAAELTAELDLGDLGLDVSDIDKLDADLGELPHAEDSSGDTREQPGIEADDSLLSATGVTQVLTEEDIEVHDLSELTSSRLEAIDTAVLGDSDATMLAPGFDSRSAHADTEVISAPDIAEETGSSEALDLDLEDFSDALQGGDTVEQPLAAEFDDNFFGESAGDTPIDLDVGLAPIGDEEPTGTEAMGPLDAQTMTEVGTKLDLARAYIDMGDPEGAKSILEEVLSEGDTGQRKEAQSLIDALPA